MQSDLAAVLARLETWFNDPSDMFGKLADDNGAVTFEQEPIIGELIAIAKAAAEISDALYVDQYSGEWRFRRGFDPGCIDAALSALAKRGME